jgi:Pentapeptide repeats (8 copies)
MATEDKGSVSSEEKIRKPERKGTRKKVNSLARFLKAWATPLSILIAAATLLWSVYQFNAQQQSDSQKAVQQQQLTRLQEMANQQHVLDQQRQTTLDTYLDRISDLLLTQHLLASQPVDEVRVLAEARTYTAVRNLDGARKGTLVRYLLGAGLISESQPIINVSNADLSGAIFTNANLRGTDFSGAKLLAVPASSDVNCAIAPCSTGGGDLRGGDLPGADLMGADLSGAKITTAQLNQAASLKGAIMPNGSKHP